MQANDGYQSTGKALMGTVGARILLVLVFALSAGACSLFDDSTTAAHIEVVLLRDALASFQVASDAPDRSRQIAKLMADIDTARTPKRFRAAYAAHQEAWESAAAAEESGRASARVRASTDISTTYQEVLKVASRYGAEPPPETGKDVRCVCTARRPMSGASAGSVPSAAAQSPVQPRPADDSCAISGHGPGNRAACGPLATGCTKTGYGPGNDAACGGQATSCERTGYGPGNAVACGGLATSCERTGYGEGNAVACGGKAPSCEKTGYGPGNAVACGGLATGCEKTGYEKGDAVACGGMATSCEKTGYGPGNAVACGGRATSCESTGSGEGNMEACGGLARR